MFGDVFPILEGGDSFDFTPEIPDICHMSRFAGVEKIECRTVS
jgi:hypothetical protein